MNRYILFFVLISMQGAIILSTETKKSTPSTSLEKVTPSTSLEKVTPSTILEEVLNRQNKLKELLEHKNSVTKEFEHVAILFNGALEKELEEKNNEIKARYLKQDILEKINALLLNVKFLEVYPHYNSPRHQETLNNIIDEKDHRGVTCPICTKSFEEIGNRVNLVCGHDICSNCLYARKYQNHCHECPNKNCKHYINNADFPIQHLKNGAAGLVKTKKELITIPKEVQSRILSGRW